MKHIFSEYYLVKREKKKERYSLTFECFLFPRAYLARLSGLRIFFKKTKSHCTVMFKEC